MDKRPEITAGGGTANDLYERQKEYPCLSLESGAWPSCASTYYSYHG